ncbi:EDSAP-1 family PEP-CTERM protein [Thiobacillus sp.]|uniref:EDSAP-1 family PEP-CTERM protein n=1 Tax=Thiobacillus sp. TaxID=924 RepID=UPI00286EACBC|nr:EDSAP-1 family PEP-CTERM protein [Thiobacillus sp.]
MLIKKLIASAPSQLLALTVAIAGASGSAHAGYAVSTNTISNFDVDFVNLNGSFSGFTFTTDVAAHGLSDEANYGATDAAGACVGAACSSYNNSFMSHGASGDYAYGDAQIGNADVVGGLGAASSIGEVSAVTAEGYAAGANTMNASFSLLAGGSVSFSFNATPYLSIAAGSGPSATAFSTMNITIRKNGSEVFSWTPNGAVGTGINNGTESFDAFNLNTGVDQGLTYNPGTGLFQATTNVLGAGNYSITINMTNQASAVPEADTYAMMLAGLGLVGYTVSRRKRTLN